MIKSVNDLWIGDLLLLKNSQRVGKFAGAKPNGKVILQIDGKKIITPLSNVSIYEVKEEFELDLDFEYETPIVKKEKKSGLNDLSLIDLHINILAPHMENQPSARILDYQLKCFNDFVSESYSRKRDTVKIIHGKGEGVLKAEIQYYLERDKRVSLISETNKGGATDIWFNY